ncbi:MAG TPA: septal ring lytic transglycosylase RlpA family protein, partial [Phenylobacterium sp.]
MASLRTIRSLALTLLAGASVAACVTPKYAARLPSAQGPMGRPGMPTPTYKIGQPYQVGGIWYVPREQPDYQEEGIASWYGPGFHQKATANGEIFDQALVSAAHTTLPLPSLVEVTNLENGRKLEVRVNDRGPFVGGRVIDLSQEAARRLGFEGKGTARVRVRYLGRAPLPDYGLQYASAGRGPVPTARPIAAPTSVSVTPTPKPEDLWAAPKTVAAPGAISATEL